MHNTSARIHNDGYRVCSYLLFCNQKIYELLEACHISIVKDPGILDESQDVDIHKPFYVL